MTSSPQLSLKTQVLNNIRSVFKIPFLERWLVGMTTDQGPGALFSKIAPNNYQYPKGSIRHVSRKGINYELDIHDLVDWHIYYGLADESQSHLFGLIQEGQLVIDVGANVGHVSLNSALRVGDGGKVISFEPDGGNFNRFRKNLSLNKHIGNIVPINSGLGDKVGKFQLMDVNTSNAGMKRIRPNTSGEVKESYAATEIEVNVLDQLLGKMDLPKVDLIKIDVEGFEMKVLKGAEETIRKDRPKMFIELDDNNLKDQGSSARELVDLLENYEYKMYRVDNSEPVHKDYNFKNCHFDIVGISTFTS